jgi:hypothetical protein
MGENIPPKAKEAVEKGLILIRSREKASLGA